MDHQSGPSAPGVAPARLTGVRPRERRRTPSAAFVLSNDTSSRPDSPDHPPDNALSPSEGAPFGVGGKHLAVRPLPLRTRIACVRISGSPRPSVALQSAHLPADPAVTMTSLVGRQSHVSTPPRTDLSSASTCSATSLSPASTAATMGSSTRPVSDLEHATRKSTANAMTATCRMAFASLRKRRDYHPPGARVLGGERDRALRDLTKGLSRRRGRSDVRGLPYGPLRPFSPMGALSRSSVLCGCRRRPRAIPDPATVAIEAGTVPRWPAPSAQPVH